MIYEQVKKNPGDGYVFGILQSFFWRMVVPNRKEIQKTGTLFTILNLGVIECDISTHWFWARRSICPT